MRQRFENIIAKFTVKQRQYLLAGILGIAAVMVIMLVIWRIGSNPNIAKAKGGGEKAAKVETTAIETAASRTDPQEIWRYREQQEREKLQNDIEDIKRALDTNNEEKQPSPRDTELDDLRQEINALRELMMSNADIKANQPKVGHNAEIAEGDKIIEKVSFTLDDDKEKASKNIDDTIPAGAFARAILLGGVDAATTINSPNDPRPMLIRLVDTGTLPRRFKSDLQDCHIVASSYGDLSSERVYARLEKLTCVERQTGEIVETQVAGYVAGEDGKVGIRGKVVEKGQEYLANSIVGGLLQGVAGVMTPQQPMMVNPLSGAAAISNESNKDRFERGAGIGAANSMDRLSKYYIEKAEKLQPVIQVAAGREVDVVFTEGTAIGTELVRKKLEEKRITKRKEEFEGDN